MCQTIYPREILPRPEWKQTISVSDIMRLCPCALLGHLFVGDYNNCIDDSAGEGMETIRREALPLHRMANLSCSLLGACFALSHFHFLPDNDGKKSWTGGALVTNELLADESNHKYFPEIIVVGWHLKNLEGLPLPYPKRFSKQKEYDDYKKEVEIAAAKRNCSIVTQSWEELTEDENNKKSRICEFIGEARVNHLPTMLNYWHFTIDMYPANDNQNPVASVSKGWKTNMAINLQDYLCRTFILLSETEQIPRIEDHEALCAKE